jgi:nitrite reductase/ring-hydroxylating ferredoxin subunit
MEAHVVGSVADLPEGSHRIVKIGNLEIGVFNVHGRYYALPNVCLHQWGPVCTGRVSGTLEASAETGWKRTWVREGEVIVCPWHSMEFDITSGQCLGHPRLHLRQYPVQVEHGRVIVVLGDHKKQRVPEGVRPKADTPQSP